MLAASLRSSASAGASSSSWTRPASVSSAARIIIHNLVAGQVGDGLSCLLELADGGLHGSLDRWPDVAGAGQLRNGG